MIGFSPYPDQHALFWNVFEQGDHSHPGLEDLCQRVLNWLGHAVDLTQVVMDAQQSVFCNYFSASGVFWREWFGLCERLYELAELDDDLGRELRAPVAWREDFAPPHIKVFIVERVASLILAMNPRLKCVAYNPFRRPYSPNPLERLRPGGDCQRCAEDRAPQNRR